MKKEKEKVPKQKGLISFTKISIYFIYPLVTPIIYGIKRYLNLEIKKENTNIEVLFLFFLINSVGFLLSGILLYILSYLKGKFGTKMNFEETEFQGIKLKSVRVVLILLSITFSFQIHEFFSYISVGKVVIQKHFLYFIHIPLLSKIFLKENVYLHQKVCLITSILVSFILSIYIFPKITSDDIIYNFNAIIDTFLFSSANVLSKVLISKYSLSPSLSLFFLGFISIIIFILIAFIFSLVEYHDISFFIKIFEFSVYNKMGAKFYIFLLIIFIDSIAFFILFVLVIYYFSPNLYVVSDQIGTFLFWIFQLIFQSQNKSTYEIVLESFGYPILLSCAFIYNEIIVLHFWGLDKDTKHRIMERERNDSIFDEDGRDSLIEIENYVVNDNEKNEKAQSFPKENN